MGFLTLNVFVISFRLIGATEEPSVNPTLTIKPIYLRTIWIYTNFDKVKEEKIYIPYTDWIYKKFKFAFRRYTLEKSIKFYVYCCRTNDIATNKLLVTMSFRLLVITLHS